MKHKNRKIFILSLSAIIPSLFLWICWPTSVNKHLKRCGIPEINSYKSCIDTETGGLFAHWLFVAVRANREQIEKYKKKLIADDCKHSIIGNSTGQVKFYEAEKFDEKIFLTEKRPEIRFKGKLHGAYLNWWNIDKVVEGDLFEKIQPNVCRYFVVLAYDQSVIYIYWSYS